MDASNYKKNKFQDQEQSYARYIEKNKRFVFGKTNWKDGFEGQRVWIAQSLNVL